MYSTRIIKMGNVNMEGTSSNSGLFTFAVADYLAERNVSIKQVSDKFILGFVLDPGESPSTVMDNLYWMVSGGFEPEIIVIGFNLITNKGHLNAIMACIKETVIDPFGYEELEGVYSERYVFVKKPNASDSKKKTIKFEIITNDNDGVIGCAMDTFHKSFEGLPDYIDSNVIVHTDVPYDGNDFNGNEATLTVDLSTAKQPKECIYRLTDAFISTIQRNPGVLGDIFGRYDEYVKNPDGCSSKCGDCCECDKTECKNHIV